MDEPLTQSTKKRLVFPDIFFDITVTNLQRAQAEGRARNPDANRPKFLSFASSSQPQVISGYSKNLSGTRLTEPSLAGVISTRIRHCEEFFECGENESEDWRPRTPGRATDLGFPRTENQPPSAVSGDARPTFGNRIQTAPSAPFANDG